MTLCIIDDLNWAVVGQIWANTAHNYPSLSLKIKKRGVKSERWGLHLRPPSQQRMLPATSTVVGDILYCCKGGRPLLLWWGLTMEPSPLRFCRPLAL
ncbi:hypothetical protein CRG98_032939 [Punica granatum]|uniref:Uncharacterized protein n=1 Tax=Punica granatum TaxID=22663 RepID=A0A2I0IRH3_PUNGR|nr:hypothetical protein CRG98_032939 [Punica granatum]